MTKHEICRFAAELLLVSFLCATDAHAARRAVLIGIDDYTASTLPRPSHPNPDKDRGWPDLKGAANDVEILRQMLVLVYGFAPKDIVVLKNQQATRAAILRAIEQHLVKPAQKGDIVFYYFAGHGSQVPNAASDEPDRLDESIVPADSRWGVEDIRDKELRPLFNCILDRGAHLTLLLDHCHSGSGFRGSTAGRGIRRAHPIVDGRHYGPRPDERGALVLAAAQDRETAYEASGDDGQMHGAFTWAWIRATRDAAAGEPAQETFLRAQGRLRFERADQAPAMLGRKDAKLRPFLSDRADRRGDRAMVAVERVQPDGHVILQGGWANGLAVDAQLRAADGSRLRITHILGLGRSVARLEPQRGMPSTIRSGALLEVIAWAAGRALCVLASRDYVGEGIFVVDDPARADYILTTRDDGKSAWVRRASNDLPQRTRWTRDPKQLRRDLFNLRRIHAWHRLESNTRSPYHLALRRCVAPPSSAAIAGEGAGATLGHELIGNETYSIVLRRSTAPMAKRYYYVFVIDSHGNSYLAFPRTGSGENRFPIDDDAPREIELGEPSAFRVKSPYGIDTYFLLSTEEPLPNPEILAWDGVRTPSWMTQTAWSIERVAFTSKRSE